MLGTYGKDTGHRSGETLLETQAHHTRLSDGRYTDHLQMILRGDAAPKLKVSITPGPDRSPHEILRLFDFRSETGNVNPDIGSIIDKAKEAMSLSPYHGRPSRLLSSGK